MVGNRKAGWSNIDQRNVAKTEAASSGLTQSFYPGFFKAMLQNA